MVNKVILVGNVGKDVEVKHLDNGGVVANFSLATNETYKDKDGNRQTKTEWHNIVIWGKKAEIAEKYVKKGDALYIEGKITNRSWEGNDGVKKYITEIVLEQYNGEFKMLGSKGDSGSSGGNTPPPPPPPAGNIPDENDLPF